MAEDIEVKDAPIVEQAATEEAPKAAAKRGKKGKRIVQAGEAHIQATFNNTIVSVCDKKGEVIQLKAGVVDGTYYDQKGINAVALIPSREVLLGRLFGSMKSPITNFARVLKQIAEKDA